MYQYCVSVPKNMIHRPCDSLDFHAPITVVEKCSKFDKHDPTMECRIGFGGKREEGKGVTV